jgi:hypothetical protein
MTAKNNETDSNATSDDGYFYTFTRPTGWINLMNPGQTWEQWTREQGVPTTRGWKVFGARPAPQAATPLPEQGELAPLDDFRKWLTCRGALGPGPLTERIFIAGWVAGHRRAPAVVAPEAPASGTLAHERIPGMSPLGAAATSSASEVELAKLAAEHYGRDERDIPALVAWERYRVEQSKVTSMAGLHAIPSFIAGFHAGRAPAPSREAAPQGVDERALFGPDNPPRLRKPGESVEDYRIAMGWDHPTATAGRDETAAFTHSARRWCASDEAWSEWRPITADEYAAHKNDSAFQFMELSDKHRAAISHSVAQAPAAGIKTWQERIGKAGFELGVATAQIDGARINARDAEIADLRAALAQQGADQATPSAEVDAEGLPPLPSRFCAACWPTAALDPCCTPMTASCRTTALRPASTSNVIRWTPSKLSCSTAPAALAALPGTALCAMAKGN